MNSISIHFRNPWLLFLIVPLLVLTVWPYLRLPVKNRKTRNRITSMVLHVIIILLVVPVLAGMSISNNYVANKNDIIILVDSSTSNKNNGKAVNDAIKSILDESPKDYQVGIIEFANECVYTVKMSKDSEKVYQNYLSSDKKLDESATNIAEAIAYAQKQLSNYKTGRIIIVTDGRQTDGNAPLAAKNAASSGTRVDVFYITPTKIMDDAQISEVVIPQQVKRGIETDIEVVIDSTTIGFADVEISYITESGAIINDSEEINLSIGTMRIPFKNTFNDYGVHEIIVNLNLITAPDTISFNNKFHAFVNIDDTASNSILIVEGIDGEGANVARILNDTGYKIDRINVKNLPATINDVTKYNEIILVNVKNEDLVKKGFHNVLENYVKNFGGGLLTIGGDRSYQKADMAGDDVNKTFSNLLPIEASTDPKAMAVVIVMDASGSMTANGSTKLDLAKAGAIASLEALASQRGDATHKFGLVTFDANLKTVIELTSVENKDTLIPQIEAITSGYGTQYSKGLQKARDMLNDPSLANAQKHIIFLTDGGAQDPEATYVGILNSLKDISVSSIALGKDGENDLNPTKVKEMVREFNGRGNYYRVENESQLYNVMLTDTEQAKAGDFINEVPFTGIINSIIPPLAGLTEMPRLGGYYGTRAKIGANVVVKTAEGDPLYVEWRPDNSKGRVGSFTSDLSGLSGSFSEDFIQDLIGQAFIRGIVKSVFPTIEISNSDISVGYIEENYLSTIRVRANLNDGETLTANVTNPAGDVTRIPLLDISKTTFGGSFIRNEPGVYSIEIARYDSKGKLISKMNSYSTFSYSKEYDNNFSEEESIVLLEEISRSGDGSFLYEAKGMFSKEAEMISDDVDVSVVFIVLSLILFLLDICARKFKFKWPHELIKKRDNVLNS